MQLSSRTSGIIVLLLLFSSVVTARQWKTSDDPFTGIPIPNTVTIRVENITKGHLRLHFEHPVITRENVTLDGREWTFLNIDGETRTWEPGKPLVPVISRPILLPNTGNITVKILNTKFTEYDNIDVLPQQPMQLENAFPEEPPFSINEKMYRTDAWYPINITQLSEPQILRDARIALLCVQPVQVNPGTRKIRLYETIDLETLPIGGAGQNELLDTRSHSAPGFAQFYDEILGADELSEVNSFALPGSMLVICCNDSVVTSYLQPYITWRIKSGRPTTLATVTIPSNDTAAIQNLITNAYNTNDPPLEQVLLIGDGSGTNTGAFMLAPNRVSNTYSDFPYVQLAGNDLLPDAFISRWSVDDAVRLLLHVNRSVNYELSPNMGPTGADTAWFRRGWGYASTSHNTWTNRSAIWYCLNMMNSYGLPTNGLYYDECSGVVNTTLLINRCNPGLLFWVHRPAFNGEIYPADVTGITMNINKCFVAMNITDNTGNWFSTGTDCIGEVLTNNGTPTQPAGAIASMGLGMLESHSATNVCLLTGAYYGLGAKKARHVSEMLYEGKLQIWRNFYSTQSALATSYMMGAHILGDVSISLWSGVPQRITANIPQQIGLGQNQIEFSVSQFFGGASVPNTMVTVLKYSTDGQTEIYSRTVTDNTGHVLFPLTNLTAGNLFITVTGNQYGTNYLPIVDTVSVAQLTADAAISGYVITDDSTNGRVGNNDHQASPGETVDLNIRLMNNGSTNGISGVFATLRSDDPRVIVSNATHTYPNLATGDSAYGNGMYRVQLLAGLRSMDILHLPLAVTVTNPAFQETLLVNIPIRSIRLSFVSDTTIPAVINPGTGADVSVTVRNMGTLATGTTTATLFSLSQYITVNTPTVTFNSIPIGTNVSNPTGQMFRLTANIRTIPGLVFTMGVAFAANAVRDTVYFSIPVGTRSTRDPVGPDAYGYLAYDDSDTGYIMHPTYHWVAIDTIPAYRTVLMDASPGADTSILLRLPFTAQHYGNRYDTITVCSNGWMSFGAARVVDSTSMPGVLESHLLHSERAFRIPGVECPKNMVAVDLQDWLIGVSPQGVYAYNDTENGWYVVSWNGVAGWGTPASNRVQIVIYDPARWPTPSGDCMLKVQYKNYYATPNFVSPPDMGYSVMGITDSTTTRGIEYSYSNFFAPGADTIQVGNNINRAILYTTAQRFVTGSLTGVVHRLSDNAPIAGASVFTLNGGYCTITDSLGRYTINDVQIGRYNVRAATSGYNTIIDTVTIREQQTSTLNFWLTAPGFRLSVRDTTVRPNDSISVTLLDTGQTSSQRIYLRNTGNGLLSWNTQLVYSGFSDETDTLWNPVMSFNATQACAGDQLISGVVFDGCYFWMTGANNYNIPHHLYKLDRNGTLLRTFNCPDSVGSFGWRDLTFDGRYLYGSYSNYIDKIDTANGRIIQRYLAPGVNPARAMTTDTAGGLLYYCDQASVIYKMRLNDGVQMGSIPNPSGGGVYGLAWYPNDPDSMMLYAFVRDSTNHQSGSRIYKINTTTEGVRAMVTLGLPGERAAGISITPYWNPMFWILATALQSINGTRIALFELASNTSWISYHPVRNTLQPNQWDTITVNLNSRLMMPFRYRIGLRFNTNSLSGSPIVPIIMNVTRFLKVESNSGLSLPNEYSLEQNYPNPFNPTTTIRFSLPTSIFTTCKVYDVNGRLVASLINGLLPAGTHATRFDGSILASGIYFVQLNAGSFSSQQKIILLR